MKTIRDASAIQRTRDLPPWGTPTRGTLRLLRLKKATSAPLSRRDGRRLRELFANAQSAGQLGQRPIGFQSLAGALQIRDERLQLPLPAPPVQPHHRIGKERSQHQ